LFSFESSIMGVMVEPECSEYDRGMDFVEAMQTYFRGEKTTGLSIIPLGLALVAFAAWIWRTEGGGFRWALVVSLGLVGAAAAIGGAALALKTGPQVAALEALYQRDPAALVAGEAPRMQKVNANWIRLKITWTVLAIVACGLALFVRRGWAEGLGAALLLSAALAMMIDTFAERRAHVYSAELDALAASLR
jgi:hypothetical protein